MKMNQRLPFKVGQLAESKSFERGFRAAWFRCKIKDARSLKENMNCSLEYFDFPDEKVRWTQVYQKPVSQEKKKHLMVRPNFPPVYQESQVPDIDSISEVIAIVDDWKVGDLVDWWSDDCYWSGQITHLVDEDKVKIKLPEPPVGEGETYDAFRKDLRPSLDWSPENGWTVPVSKESEGSRYCARLVKPVHQVEQSEVNDLAEEGVSFQLSTDFSTDSVSSHGSDALLPPRTLSSNPPMETQKQPSEQDKKTPDNFVGSESGDGNLTKPSSSDGVSCAHDEDPCAVAKTGSEDCNGNNGFSKRMRVGGAGYFNSSFSDTIESSILDFEELLCRIKWLQRVHEFGLESAASVTPSWRFLEERLSFKHK